MVRYTERPLEVGIRTLRLFRPSVVALVLLSLVLEGCCCGRGLDRLRRQRVGDGEARCARCPEMSDLRTLYDEEIWSPDPRALNPDECACLACPGGDERRLVAAYLVDTGRVWPSGLQARMMRSDNPADRRLALLHCAVTCDADEFWKAIESERDPIVVENGLDALLQYEAFDGDRRMLTQLRRVVGVRVGRPMKAVHILRQLVPSAELPGPLGSPELLVGAWKRWLDEHIEELRWDGETGRFVRVR